MLKQTCKNAYGLHPTYVLTYLAGQYTTRTYTQFYVYTQSYVRQHTMYLAWYLIHCSCIELTAVKVLLRFRKPCCDWGNSLFASKNCRIFLLAIFSMTFDTALSRLTGLYFVLSVLLPFFLKIGMHFAIFQLEGKIPLSKELFIIQVNGSAIRHCS